MVRNLFGYSSKSKGDDDAVRKAEAWASVSPEIRATWLRHAKQYGGGTATYQYEHEGRRYVFTASEVVAASETKAGLLSRVVGWFRKESRADRRG